MCLPLKEAAKALYFLPAIPEASQHPISLPILGILSLSNLAVHRGVSHCSFGLYLSGNVITRSLRAMNI